MTGAVAGACPTAGSRPSRCAGSCSEARPTVSGRGADGLERRARPTSTQHPDIDALDSPAADPLRRLRGAGRRCRRRSQERHGIDDPAGLGDDRDLARSPRSARPPARRRGRGRVALPRRPGPAAARRRGPHRRRRRRRAAPRRRGRRRARGARAVGHRRATTTPTTPSDEKFHDGWLRTGDVGTLDELGYITLTDRAKDVIKSGGEWISSVDLENALMAHPDVVEAAVVGHPRREVAGAPARVRRAPRGRDADARASCASSSASTFAKWQLPDAWAFIDAGAAHLGRQVRQEGDPQVVRRRRARRVERPRLIARGTGWARPPSRVRRGDATRSDRPRPAAMSTRPWRRSIRPVDLVPVGQARQLPAAAAPGRSRSPLLLVPERPAGGHRRPFVRRCTRLRTGLLQVPQAWSGGAATRPGCARRRSRTVARRGCVTGGVGRCRAAQSSGRSGASTSSVNFLWMPAARPRSPRSARRSWTGRSRRSAPSGRPSRRRRTPR